VDETKLSPVRYAFFDALHLQGIIPLCVAHLLGLQTKQEGTII
jgi:hypothetical protein